VNGAIRRDQASSLREACGVVELKWRPFDLVRVRGDTICAINQLSRKMALRAGPVSRAHPKHLHHPSNAERVALWRAACVNQIAPEELYRRLAERHRASAAT
jgi:hypothetical protein